MAFHIPTVFQVTHRIVDEDCKSPGQCRFVALQLALKMHEYDDRKDPDRVVATAQVFEEYLSGAHDETRRIRA